MKTILNDNQTGVVDPKVSVSEGKTPIDNRKLHCSGK